jgi:hypothetical protein
MSILKHPIAALIALCLVALAVSYDPQDDGRVNWTAGDGAKHYGG